MRFYTIFRAPAGETFAPNFKPVRMEAGRGPLQVAQKHIGKNVRRLAVNRFTNGEADFIVVPS